MSQNPFADPYQSPQPVQLQYAQLAPGQKPRVWVWYVVYCVAMALLYLVCLGFGVVVLLAGDGGESGEDYIVGVVMLIFCLPLFLFFAAAPLLPRSKFAWFYGFATIGLGLTSCCTLPFSIALLIQWMNPQVRAYFHAL